MEYKLTQYSHGAGCGCKISPKVLSEILSGEGWYNSDFPGLLVGNAERDDAAVYDLGDGSAIISTTDFFMPIVDDAFDFGKIASVNAISDVYAMGGKPMLAIAILGWPIDKLPPSVAGEVMAGAKAACAEAGIPLGGGHSIDSPEPIFGLAVTGRVETVNIKRNNGARPGDVLYLTKPLGVGILTTAQKKGILKPEHVTMARNSMVKLNNVGSELGTLDYVHAMTDVTGFGLGGHLIEMCEGSDVSADISIGKLPLLDSHAIDFYLDQKSIPGGTFRNYDSYGSKICPVDDRQRSILCDPQTSGGLLLAVDPKHQNEIQLLLESRGLVSESIGAISEQGKHQYLINVAG